MRTGDGSEPPGLSIECVRHRDCLTVAVAGEVDLATAGDLRIALERALDGHHRVEIDLGDTTFMDCTGLAVLVEAHRRLGPHRQSLVLRNPNPTVLRLLKVSGVGQLIDMVRQPSQLSARRRPATSASSRGSRSARALVSGW